jgi:hypothetical protein
MTHTWKTLGWLASLLLFAGIVDAATYFVSATGDGSDSANGTSETTPWATITKVNNTAFAAGDIVQFKRGSTWTGVQLTIDSSGVIYQAYGSGNAPVVQRAASPTMSGYTHAIEVSGSGNTIKDFLVRHGHEAGIFLTSSAQGNTIASNEVTASGTGVMVSGPNNLITSNYVHDLHMIVATSGGDDDYGAVCFWLNIGHNEVSHNRGVNCSAPSPDYGTDGGFVEVWQNGDGTNVHHNSALNTNGFFEVGGRQGTARDMVVAYNILDGTGSSMCLQIGTSFSVSIDNLRFENNTVPNGSGRFLCISGATTASTLIVRNNIFPAGSVFSGAFTHTNNLYRTSPGTLGPGEKVGDPLFVNPGAGDYHLQPMSPAIDAGADLGYTEDFDGDVVPQGTAPDMGAFESGGITPPPCDPPTCACQPSLCPPPPEILVINDNAFTYTGRWLLATGEGKYLGDDHYTDRRNDRYRYTFTGTQVKVFVTTDRHHGRAAVSIDGGAETIVDLYSPTRMHQVPIYTSPTLAPGSHTVTVRCTRTRNPSSTGHYITADRMDITP